MRCLLGAMLLGGLLCPNSSFSKFASSGEVATGYEYNSNIFFAPEASSDFVYFINPTLRVLWQPASEASSFSAGISAPLLVFTQNTRETNFGDNLLLNMAYHQEVSPRLSFVFRNDFRRVGRTRTGINSVTSGLLNQGPDTPGVPVFKGETGLTTRGEFLTNAFSTRFRYEYGRNMMLTGGYTGIARIFIDEGGNASSHSVGGRLTYRLSEKWRFPLGYRLQVLNSRNGAEDIVHNIDVGGRYQDEIRPSLTLLFSTGLGIRAEDSGGPRVINNINLGLRKLWEISEGNIGIQRALTGSLGVAGPSITTSIYGDYRIQITREWIAFTGVRASFFDTSETNFNTVQAQAGIQYRITSWLFSSLRYFYRSRNAGSGAEDTELQTSEQIESHSILLSFSADFDLWPTVGLAHGQGIAEDGRLR